MPIGDGALAQREPARASSIHAVLSPPAELAAAELAWSLEFVLSCAPQYT